MKPGFLDNLYLLEKPNSFTAGFNMHFISGFQSNAPPMWSDINWMHLHLALNVFKRSPIVILSPEPHVNAGVQEAWALLSDRWGHSYMQTVGQRSESKGQGSWHFIKLPTTGKSQSEKESATGDEWLHCTFKYTKCSFCSWFLFGEFSLAPLDIHNQQLLHINNFDQFLAMSGHLAK